jgi:hypothetical protein
MAASCRVRCGRQMGLSVAAGERGGVIIASGRRQGPRFVAFYGCMFYAMMRPSEVISLTRDGCDLPGHGWGRLIFADASPAAGREFTDDGRVPDARGLKGPAPAGRCAPFHP